MSVLNHYIAEDIEQTMKENFEYEAKTVEILFERYQKYKPLVTGIYGQDVVAEKMA